MKTIHVPLVGTYNTRGLKGDATLTLNQDQRFLNCTFNLVQNPVTGKATIYVEKRPGWGQDTLVESGTPSTGLSKPQSYNASISAFGETNSVIYLGTNNVGTITGRALHFTETIVSDITYAMIKSSDGTGWYFAEDANNATAYTCDGNNSTTITDIKIAGVNSTAGMYSGQKLTAATNITAGSRIVSVNSGAFTAVLDTITTGGAFNDLATTKEPIAKIIDADFVTTGTFISAFVEMDGYLFYTNDASIWNSDLNSVTAYTATAFKSPNMSPDPPKALARQKNVVICLAGASIEAFQNAGYATGSPLERIPQAFERIGVLDQRSVAVLENDIYFVSSPNTGDVGVWRIRGLSATKVSTPNLDRIIGTVAASGGAVYASGFRLGGYPYVSLFMSFANDGNASMLLLESGDKMLLEDADDILLEGGSAQAASFARLLVYNAGINIWSEWDSDEACFITGISTGSSNAVLATSRTSTSGKIYRIDPIADGQLYQDDGTAYTMEIRTSKIDGGTPKRKFIKSVKLVDCDISSTNAPYLSYSDDDYATFSTPRLFDTSTAEPKITMLGSHKGGRAYKITDASNAPFRAGALEIEFEVAA